jgi:hypothetical protein
VRWFLLFLLGLASIYPLYWMAQFVLFFLPAALRSLFLHQGLTVVGVSYLQATAVAVGPRALPVGWESLLIAVLFALLIWYFRGDKFLTGALAIVVLGQSALLPFLNQILLLGHMTAVGVSGSLFALGLICYGLHQILRLTGGADFLDKLALLSLLAVLPQAALWLAFRLHYPYFGTKFLLLLLAPLYLGALLAAALPHRLAESAATPAPLVEIVAGFTFACLLLIAIALSTRAGDRHHADLRPDVQAAHSVQVARSEPSRLAITPMGCYFSYGPQSGPLP